VTTAGLCRVDSFIDHPRSGMAYNFGRVCLSVCQMITFESLDVGSSLVHICTSGIPPENTGQVRIYI